jgi:hypothetical protein
MKKLYFDQELVKHQSNMKKTWENKATKKQKNNKDEISSIYTKNKIISDPTLMANEFNEFFANIAVEIQNQIPPIDPSVDPSPLIEPNHLLNMNETPLTPIDTKNALEQLQTKHSLDPMNISTAFLKLISQQICAPLTHIFNLSITSGEIPVQLKTAKIVPIFKSGSPTDMNNYRPISLLSSFGKILEKIVANKLTSFLETNKLISNCQFGFRKNHSTVHPMTSLLNRLTSSLNAKKHSIVIFCDLKKAFDTCDHDILLKKTQKSWSHRNQPQMV